MDKVFKNAVNLVKKDKKLHREIAAYYMKFVAVSADVDESIVPRGLFSALNPWHRFLYYQCTKHLSD